MFRQDLQPEVKLDWMYKGPHSTVEREEYLLGRSVDKTLEHINEEEKQKQTGAAPKHKVEHECIPPSIRDFNKIVQAEQVDLSAKLQEDPLVAIKKREEETRRQFLQNPVQLAKLQRALKAQESKQHKKKKKTKKREDKRERRAKKCKEERNLDTILIHKYEEFKDRLSQDDLQNILDGILTDSNSEESEANSEEDSSDSDDASRRFKPKKKYELSDNEQTPFQNKRKPAKRFENEPNHFRNYSERRRNEPRRRSVENDPQKAHTRSEKPPNREASRERTRKGGRWREDRSASDRKRERSRSKDRKSRKSSSSSSSSEAVHDSDSDSRERSKAKRNYGLVTSDGKKIKLRNKSPEGPKKAVKKPVIEPVKQQVGKSRVKKLTEEEKDKLRKEMQVNAIYHDRERSENVRRHREGQEKEKKEQDYDPEFVHKQMVKSANSSSVESRIKANINNIQRSSRDMERHFSKRH